MAVAARSRFLLLAVIAVALLLEFRANILRQGSGCRLWYERPLILALCIPFTHLAHQRCVRFGSVYFGAAVILTMYGRSYSGL